MCYRYGMVPRYTTAPAAWQGHAPDTLVGIVCRVKGVKRDLKTETALGRRGGYYLVLVDANNDEQ